MEKQEVELKFYNVLRGNVEILEFEKWVYDVDEVLINQYFGEGFYFDLASLNYKNKYVLNELEKLLYSRVPFGRYEQMKVSYLLNCVIQDKGYLCKLLEELYDLYCDGYIFLRNLGLIFASCDSYETYQTYKFDAKTRTYLKREARRILSYLDSGKIVITSEYEYDDNRTDEEMIELYEFEKKKETAKIGILKAIVYKICRTFR